MDHPGSAGVGNGGSEAEVPIRMARRLPSVFVKALYSINKSVRKREFFAIIL
jgi:hypothetical protein